MSTIQKPWDTLSLQNFPKLARIGDKGLSGILTRVMGCDTQPQTQMAE
jgi:hypothetical protein